MSDPETVTEYELPDALRLVLTPPRRLSVSAWCDEHRFLTDKFSAEPGRWDTNRVPYLREIMDAFADPNVRTIMLLKCARVGGTELLNNILGYTVDARPMPIMYVLPTQPDVQDEFGGRVKSIFETSEKLREHILGGNWATEEHISLDSCDIYGGWATSPGTLIRKTIGVAVFDEIDNCELAAGKLGNTWELLLKRLETFGYRAKAVAVTTPTTEDASGWKLYQKSDKRKCYVPCPHCGHYQVLKFENLVFDSKIDPEIIELDKLADLRCVSCASLIHEADQPWMIARCVWVPDSQRIVSAYDFDGDDRQRPTIDGVAPRTRNRGYWLNCLYSPWVSWSATVAKFLKVKDDPETFRVFKNAWLGEPWAESAEAPDDAALSDKVKVAQYPAKEIPPTVKALLCGVDVQQHSVFYVVRGYGPNGESWLIDYDQVDSLEDVHRIVAVDGYAFVGEPGVRMRCYARAIDSGYRTDEVIAHTDAVKGAIPVKGMLSRVKPAERVNVAPRESTPRWVWQIDTTRFKSRLASAMKIPAGLPGSWNLCANASLEYLKHITSEHYVHEKSKQGVKRWAWRPKTAGRPNHWWDCEVYIQALAEILAERGELNVRAFHSQTPRKALGTTASPAPAQQSQVLRPQPRRIQTAWDK